MNARRACVALAVGASVALAGCVATNEIGGNDNPTPTTTTIPPESGSLGADYSYGGVQVTMLDIMPFDQSPNAIPRIKAVMRAENLTDAVQQNPDVELRCDESANGGDWYLGSTWEPNAPLPVNAVSQGEVIVGFPIKGANPEYPVVKCSSPKLLITLDGKTGEPSKVVVYPVDDSVIAEAIMRPRGPALPLPPRGQ